MLSPSLAPSTFSFRDELESVLDTFFAERLRTYSNIDAQLATATAELAALTLGGGKRVRPWFVEWGNRAAGGEPDGRLARAAAAVEMVHTFALIQDDIVDRSGIRRGRTAVHLALAAEGGDHYGLSAALLVSDLAFIWADVLLLDAGYRGSQLEAAFRVFNTLREEVTIGQFQDLAVSSFGVFNTELALQVNERKTAGYTVRRPLELGMTLAGAPDRLLAEAAAYAQPAGIAFQIRDDLLGAFGDSSETGKPDGDDLVTAKPTWLLARGLAGDSAASRELRRLVDLPSRGLNEVALMREALLVGGAVAAAEDLVDGLRRKALVAARGMSVPEACRSELQAMTARLVDRRA